MAGVRGLLARVQRVEVARQPRATRSLALMTLLWVLFDFTILIGYTRLVHTGLLRRRADLIARLSAGFLLLVACSGFLYAVKEVLSGAA